jgi:hypothetical protein
MYLLESDSMTVTGIKRFGQSKSEVSSITLKKDDVEAAAGVMDHSPAAMGS